MDLKLTLLNTKGTVQLVCHEIVQSERKVIVNATPVKFGKNQFQLGNLLFK